jgi:hypothetical protein
MDLPDLTSWMDAYSRPPSGLLPCHSDLTPWTLDFYTWLKNQPNFAGYHDANMEKAMQLMKAKSWTLRQVVKSIYTSYRDHPIYPPVKQVEAEPVGNTTD